MLYTADNTQIGSALYELENTNELPNDPRLFPRLNELIDSIHWKSVVDVCLKHKIFPDSIVDKSINLYHTEIDYIYDLVSQYFECNLYSEKAFHWCIHNDSTLITSIDSKYHNDMVQFIWKNGHTPTGILNMQQLQEWTKIAFDNYPKRAPLVKKTLKKMYPYEEIPSIFFKNNMKYFESAKYSDFTIGGFQLHKIILDQISPTILENDLEIFVEKWNARNTHCFFGFLYGNKISTGFKTIYQMGTELNIPDFDKYVLSQIKQSHLREADIVDIFTIGTTSIKDYIRKITIEQFGCISVDLVIQILNT